MDEKQFRFEEASRKERYALQQILPTKTNYSKIEIPLTKVI